MGRILEQFRRNAGEVWDTQSVCCTRLTAEFWWEALVGPGYLFNAPFL